MAVPVCLELPDIPTPEEIVLPGGITLASLHNEINQIPSLCQPSLNLSTQIQPALAPLKPFFDVLETAIQIFKCVKAIPKAVATLNPKPLLECIPQLAQKVDQLLRLIPQLSIPYTIVSVIDAIISLLNCTINFIEGLITQTERLAERIAKAAEIDDEKLDAILECANTDIEAMRANSLAALDGFGSLIGILNVLMSLLGLPEIDLSAIDVDVPLDEMIEPLRQIIRILEEIRRLIPLP